MPATRVGIPGAFSANQGTKRLDLNSLLSGLVGALFGALVTYGTTYMMLNADEEQAKRDRVAEVYSTYLDDANAYATFVQYYVGAQTRNGEDPASLQVLERIERATEGMETARREYRSSTYDVYVFGSNAAVAAHNAIADSLPDPQADLLGEEINSLDVIKFRSAFDGFLDVFCDEAVEDARAGCGSNGSL